MIDFLLNPDRTGALSLIGRHALAPGGCDQSAHKYREGDAKENFAAYH
jgi:hypothetical protein